MIVGVVVEASRDDSLRVTGSIKYMVPRKLTTSLYPQPCVAFLSLVLTDFCYAWHGIFGVAGHVPAKRPWATSTPLLSFYEMALRLNLQHIIAWATESLDGPGFHNRGLLVLLDAWSHDHVLSHLCRLANSSLWRSLQTAMIHMF